MVCNSSNAAIPGNDDNVPVVAVIDSSLPGAGRTGTRRGTPGPGSGGNVVWGCLLRSAVAIVVR